LIEQLAEIGFVSQGMYGAIPLSWQEIRAWQELTNTELPSEEALQLKQLSRDYCSEYNAADKPHRPKPSETPDENREATKQSFAAMVKYYKGEGGV
jgi:hypothetical protein